MPFSGVKRLVTALLRQEGPVDRPEGGSYPVTNRRVIRDFIADPENTFLVSFPRTGSHWLRMLMERYFGRPSLTRVFFYPERTDYLSLHTHDLDLTTARRRVIYLYREPVATIYSQLSYHRLGPDDPQAIRHWSEMYGRHLAKWLHSEEFTTHKTVVRYDRLRQDLTGAFEPVCRHFGAIWEPERLERIARELTPDQTRQKTAHDPRVVDTSQAYQLERDRFTREHGSLVWDVLLTGRPYLEDFFT
jgi:hypothetical protein